MAEKFAFRVAVHLILIRNGSVLLARRCNTGWKDGWYSVLAGHVDGKETITDAMRREAREEGGIDILVSELSVAHTMHRMCADALEYIDFFLTTTAWTGEPRIMELDKCDDLAWFPLSELPKNTIPYIRHAIIEIQNARPFSEFDENQ